MTASRFLQAHREARWSCALAVLYLIGWVVSAYFLEMAPGFTGLPIWFEWSCIFLPIVFCVLCALMVHFVFKEVSLEAEGSTPSSVASSNKENERKRDAR